MDDRTGEGGTQDIRDDGYETGNGGEVLQQKPPEPQDEPPQVPEPIAIVAAATAVAEPSISPVPTPQPETSGADLAQDRDSDEKCKPPDSPREEDNSVSNSPEEQVHRDESSISGDRIPSPCPSNSRSDSIGDRPVIPFAIPAHQEDSSSQSQPYPMVADMQMNPYDLKNRLQQQYNPIRAPEMTFGGIKREPYDMSLPEPDPYAHYKRNDQPYNRDLDPYNNRYNLNYKEEMYGFGLKRDQNPYSYPTHQLNQFGGVKREHEGEMLGYNGIKRECSEDPYSFVDEEAAMCAMLGAQGNPGVMSQVGNPLQNEMMVAPPHVMQNMPKKRGRKKKIKDDCLDIKQEGVLDGALMSIAKPIKERKKHDRFNGMSEEEVCRRTLPDHLAQNLDIIIIGINPGLFAAYKGHHYAGPGNHFWKCLYLSGLTQEQMSADEDYKLLHFGIGFTNMVQRATKGSADLTRKEIKEGSQVLLEKLQTFRPKIAVFNGKLIYEVFSGKKDFCFGRQPDTVHGTNTYMWVMPSSSARCAQLPRAADKVPFYSALRRFRDYLNGTLPHVDESELVFPDTTCRRAHEDQEIRRLLGPDTPCETMILEDGTEVPVKKKRGRPKKIKLENGEVAPPVPRAPRVPKQVQPDCLNGEQPPKKKRGRPKKVRPEEQFLVAQQQQQQQLPNMPLNPSLNLNQNVDNQYRDYRQTAATATAVAANAGLNLESEASQLLYSSNQSLSGGGTVQNVPSGPATSPYFQAEPSPNLDSAQNMGGVAVAAAYGQSPGPFSQSPRPHGVGYGSSPRSAGYSQSPQRHQPLPHSYSNSPVPQVQTPHPYSQSPVPQNAQYSQSPPLNRNNTPTYSQQFAHSPAAAAAVPYSQSPAPQALAHSYPQSPLSQQYSQSPVQSYQHSPQIHRNHPYSPASHSMYQSPVHPVSMNQSYQSTELSTEISAAISSPNPTSPALGHIDFEPPVESRRLSPEEERIGHSALNLISSSSNASSPVAAAVQQQQQQQPMNQMYEEAQSPEQRLGFQVPTPSGSNNSSLVAADLSQMPRNSPRDVDNASNASVSSSQHERMGYLYPEAGSSPRQPDAGGLLPHHTSNMYGNPFARMGSTPPAHQPSPFSSQSGNGAFRGLSLDGGQTSPQSLTVQPAAEAEYDSPGKSVKQQDVSSKSLSGLESLVDQIPSIADGGPALSTETAPPATAVPLENPYAAHAPSLYGYSPYQPSPYGPPPNNGYSSLAAGSFVGYPGSPYGQLMRPTPGYLPDALSPYHPHSGYAAQQYGPGAGYGPAAPPNYSAYYNGYGPPSQAPNMPTYLSTHVLDHIHKNAAADASSVSFGGFC